MAVKKTTTKKVSPKKATSSKTTIASELIIVTTNKLGAFARLSEPLTKKKINIECYTGYEWGGESAFRLITDNNVKAAKVLRAEGYFVEENPVCLWQTANTPGKVAKATVALENANINTYCTYTAAYPTVKNGTIAFNTSDVMRTAEILNNVK